MQSDNIDRGIDGIALPIAPCPTVYSDSSAVYLAVLEYADSECRGSRERLPVRMRTLITRFNLTPVDTKTELDAVHDLTGPSLIRGGPFYRGQRATRLIHPDQWNMGRRIALAIVIGWLPLMVLTAVFNSGGLASLLIDYRVYSSMLRFQSFWSVRPFWNRDSEYW